MLKRKIKKIIVGTLFFHGKHQIIDGIFIDILKKNLHQGTFSKKLRKIGHGTYKDNEKRFG